MYNLSRENKGTERETRCVGWNMCPKGFAGVSLSVLSFSLEFMHFITSRLTE